jgi:single-strand DNA-binding protein
LKVDTKHVNRVYLIGNLGADAEVRTFDNGDKKVRLRLASTRRWKDPSDQDRERTTWVDCDCWGEAAEKAAGLGKGQRISLSGSLEMDEWDDKTTGQKRTKLYVKVYEFEVEEKRAQVGEQEAPKKTGGRKKPEAAAAANDGSEIPF